MYYLLRYHLSCWHLPRRGLPWWLSGLRYCHQLLAVSHHWGPALMAVWTKTSVATDCSLGLTNAQIWIELLHVRKLPMTSSWAVSLLASTIIISSTTYHSLVWQISLNMVEKVMIIRIPISDHLIYREMCRHELANPPPYISQALWARAGISDC